MLEKFLDLYEKLPPSTNAWLCRWFLTIQVVCFLVFGYAIWTGPGTLHTVALCVCTFFSGLTFGMRQTNATLRGDSCTT